MTGFARVRRCSVPASDRARAGRRGRWSRRWY
jgi:hypothetical protein